jgi:hypothetical protein
MATGTQLPSGCLPNFPYKDGWLGGDAAYSIPLAAGQSLWLFGDSFVARTSQSRRQGARFVRNSMAISTCDARNGWQIKYYWGHQNRSAPRAFFDSGTNKYWYWPLDGFVYQGRLYIALSKVKDNPKEKLLSFETIGVNLAKVSNLSAPPSQWKIEYLKLVEGGAAIPGSAIVLNDGYVYFFTLYDEPARRHQHMILSRLPLEKLANPAAHLEYFAKDQSWKAGLNRDDALVVMETGHSEMSVRYHPEIKQWLAVSGADFLSPQIVMRTAPALTGPWSAWQTIYEIPEMNPKTPGRDPDTWCYAVKEHIEFAQAQKLLVTYACNSFKLEKLISNMGLYRPQAVLIELPPPVTHRPLFLPHPQLNSADQARPPSSPEENL